MKLFNFTRVVTAERQINPPIFWKNTTELSWFLKTTEAAYFSFQISGNNENHAIENTSILHSTILVRSNWKYQGWSFLKTCILTPRFLKVGQLGIWWSTGNIQHDFVGLIHAKCKELGKYTTEKEKKSVSNLRNVKKAFWKSVAGSL